MTNREKFMRLLMELAQISGAKVGEMTLAIYEEALAPLGYEHLVAAAKKFLIERKPRDAFPAIVDFKEALGAGTATDDSKVAKAVDDLVEANRTMGRFADPEMVRGKIGELAWHVVKQSGGWTHFCNRIDGVNIEDGSMSYFRHDLAKEAKAYLQLNRLGQLDKPVGFDNQVAALPPAVQDALNGIRSIPPEGAKTEESF